MVKYSSSVSSSSLSCLAGNVRPACVTGLGTGLPSPGIFANLERAAFCFRSLVPICIEAIQSTYLGIIIKAGGCSRWVCSRRFVGVVASHRGSCADLLVRASRCVVACELSARRGVCKTSSMLLAHGLPGIEACHVRRSRDDSRIGT